MHCCEHCPRPSIAGNNVMRRRVIDERSTYRRIRISLSLSLYLSPFSDARSGFCFDGAVYVTVRVLTIEYERIFRRALVGGSQIKYTRVCVYSCSVCSRVAHCIQGFLAGVFANRARSHALLYATV